MVGIQTTTIRSYRKEETGFNFDSIRTSGHLKPKNKLWVSGQKITKRNFHLKRFLARMEFSWSSHNDRMSRVIRTKGGRSLLN